MGALTVTERRGPYHNLSGPRLPSKPKYGRECWRCTADRRVLHEIVLMDRGRRIMIGIAQVCGDCLASASLDPDPLNVPELT